MQMDLARQLEQLNREMDEQLLTDLQVQLVSCSNDVTLVCRERIVPSDLQRRETAVFTGYGCCFSCCLDLMTTSNNFTLCVFHTVAFHFFETFNFIGPYMLTARLFFFCSTFYFVVFFKLFSQPNLSGLVTAQRCLFSFFSSFLFSLLTPPRKPIGGQERMS